MLVLVTAVTSRATPAFEGHARLWLGPGVDTNAKREFVSSGVATAPDAFLFGLLQLDGLLVVDDRLRVLGTYDVAGRKFFTQPSEDTVVQSAQLEATVAFARVFAIGIGTRARDRRGASRDYTDLQAGAVLDFFPADAVDVRVAFNAHRFLYYNRFTYSFFGPDGSLTARYRINRNHAVSAFGFYNPRTYNAHARLRPDENGESRLSSDIRSDAVIGGGVSYSYRGPFHFTFAYSYFDQTSNSFGETVRRHRVSATLGLRLPWKVTLLSTLTFQPSIFPDGVYLNPDLTIVEDDENVSSVTLKLVRPLTSWLDLDLRYAGFLGFYPQRDFLYARHVVSVGFAASF